VLSKPKELIMDNDGVTDTADTAGTRTVNILELVVDTEEATAAGGETSHKTIGGII